ncbi:MAG: four helix bundle protein [Flavobacteriales bacterium]|nr:four helix bundle protein [Flavobacteriales bacterium]
MASITDFEDLDIWKDARVLSKKVREVTKRKSFDDDRDLRWQIRSAAVSAMSNIAEGFERNNNNFFLQFLRTAKGSAGEVRSQLYSCLDAGYVTEEEFKPLREEAKLLGQRIGKLMDYLEAYQRLPGNATRNTVKARRNP